MICTITGYNVNKVKLPKLNFKNNNNNSDFVVLEAVENIEEVVNSRFVGLT